MRIGFLSPLALALLAGISLQAQASSDDSCYPDWRVSRDSLDPCNNLPFLSPGNDSRANLRLLLADKKAAPLAPTTRDLLLAICVMACSEALVGVT